jgi:hypothetical protein
MGVHGRTNLTSAVIVPNVATASAFVAYDAVGSSFEMPLAVGAPGGVAYTLNVFNNAPTAAGNPNLALALFNTAFTPTTEGTIFTITGADQDKFLGFIEIAASDWVTAGTDSMHAQIEAPGVGLHSVSGGRSLYGQFQIRDGNRFGATANPLTVTLTNLID